MRVAQVRVGDRVGLLVDVDNSGAGLDVSTALASRGNFEGLTGAITCARQAQTSLAILMSELAAESTSITSVDFMEGRYLTEQGTWDALDAPVHPPEVWAAGVTYKISREARLAETAGSSGDIYSRVYDAERPELFLKDSANRRTTGPYGDIGVRADSYSTVPEPEFALVLDADATMVGLMLANDVTARDIEAQNPLYLPQAKIFAGGCALGPVVTVFDSRVTPEDQFGISLTIRSSAGAWRFHGATDTSRLKRSFAELAGYLSRFNIIEDGTVLLTGTGIVPPLDLGLKHGDTVTIASNSLGMLSNTVCTVRKSGQMDSRHPATFGTSPLNEAWSDYVQLVDEEQERNKSFSGEHPHYTEDGRWHRLRIDATSGWVGDTFYDHGNWTAGFAAAQVWLANVGNPDPSSVSKSQETSLRDVATRASDMTTHDLGFLFYPSFVLGEQLGFLVSTELAPAEEAAFSLSERFNPVGNYLQAFGPIGDARSRATSTIDTMMNLPLLWWAAGATGDDGYYHRAMEHAKTSARNFFRPDGSTYHLIRYDPETGEAATKGTFQGESDDSTWSRGQAWAIAGFAWCYAETGEDLFRATAMKAWEYFAPRVPSDGVVPYDFGGITDETEDASASAIAALGALILSESSDNATEANGLREDAISILQRLSENAVRRQNDSRDGILQRSCYSKPHERGMSGALPYGDFYYGLALALATGKISLRGIMSRRRHPRDASRNSALLSTDRNVVP